MPAPPMSRPGEVGRLAPSSWSSTPPTRPTSGPSFRPGLTPLEPDRAGRGVLRPDPGRAGVRRGASRCPRSSRESPGPTTSAWVSTRRRRSSSAARPTASRSFLCEIDYFPHRRPRRRPRHPSGLHVRRVSRERSPARDDPDPGALHRTRVVGPSTPRAIGGKEKEYDFAPHVVDVATTFRAGARGDPRGRVGAPRQPVGIPVGSPICLPDDRDGVGAPRDPPSNSPRHHQRRTARPRRVLAPRRRDRGKSVAR